jgi:hypothetical protein
VKFIISLLQVESINGVPAKVPAAPSPDLHTSTTVQSVHIYDIFVLGPAESCITATRILVPEQAWMYTTVSLLKLFIGLGVTQTNTRHDSEAQCYPRAVQPRRLSFDALRSYPHLRK